MYVFNVSVLPSWRIKIYTYSCDYDDSTRIKQQLLTTVVQKSVTL